MSTNSPFFRPNFRNRGNFATFRQGSGAIRTRLLPDYHRPFQTCRDGLPSFLRAAGAGADAPEPVADRTFRFDSAEICQFLGGAG